MSDDHLDLARFVTAQENTFDAALAELTNGRKRSHWIWFIFPQMRGLGVSPTATFYGIVSIYEARAYLAHPVLGDRLMTCTRAVLSWEGKALNAIFGSPDDMKFCSSMTLFARACKGTRPEFQAALDQFCGGRLDRRTLELVEG